jgi:hypothetical protein
MPITEQYKFSIHADFFNIFNRVDFTIPMTTITALDFDRWTSTVGTPRVIQFAARFEL